MRLNNDSEKKLFTNLNIQTLDLGLQWGMRLIPICEDPELSLFERASDGACVLGLATVQLTLILVLSPVWVGAGLLIGGVLVLNETDWGKKICKVLNPWIGLVLKPFVNIFTIPSVPDARNAAELALEKGDAVALKEALMRCRFLGFRAVRPRHKVALLERALKKYNDSDDLDDSLYLCDAIISAGCKVKGFWPDYDILKWALGRRYNLERVQWALAHGATPRLNRKDWGRSIVDDVLDPRELDVLEAIVEAYPLGEWAKGRFLQKAADEGASSMLEWMLARPSWARAANRELTCRRRPTLLMRAAWSMKCVQMLLPRSRANQASYTHVQPALVRLLCGSPFVRVGAGAYALSIDMNPPFNEILENFETLAGSGADMKGKSWRRVTLLHKAALLNDMGPIDWLLRYGLDPLAKDKDGETPLMWALKACNVTGINELLKVSEIDATNYKGQSALTILARVKTPDDSDRREKMLMCGEALVGAGANPQLRDKKGLRAIDQAACMSNAEIFELLSPRSDWNPEVVKKALKSKKVLKMKRPHDVARIKRAADRKSEVQDIEAATPIPGPAARSRRL